jgi:molecular chaperone HtpG
MAKKQFKTESKRLLDLMIHSIYTHKEIFLRELISNASDALDKLAYRALTDEGVGLNRSDFYIFLTPDKAARTLTISDNGIGMTKEELENNLGVIARSGSLQFKKELQEGGEGADIDIIGQFGVGFYSAFMVADHVTVLSRAYGSDEAWCWEASGADGYTIKPCEKQQAGTDIVIKLKEDTDEEKYGQFLDTYQIENLVKKYSDYIRYPIRMETEQSKMKPRPENAPEDYKPEWETYTEEKTLNSMVPLWQRGKAEATEEELNAFYKEKFGDYQDPLACIRTSVEGAVTYQSLLYIPAHAPYDFYTRDYEAGLQLYSSGVLIMENCADLLPEHFRFVKGVVDSQDFSLNISREMLQHTRQLKIISANLEKKIKAELLRLLGEDREKYLKFWSAFGRHLKYGVVADFATHKELLRDLLLFPCTGQDQPTSLSEYVARMPEEQKYIYYAAGESAQQIAKLPQAERILSKNFEILCLTEEVDEFVVQALQEHQEKKLKSINEDDALAQTDEEKAEAERLGQENRDVLDFLKQTLGDRIKEARVSQKLVSHPVCMTADGPVSIEMEKYFKSLGSDGPDMKAERVLELNPASPALAALRAAVKTDPERAKKYAEILYNQALLIAGLSIEDPSSYADLVCSLMQE